MKNISLGQYYPGNSVIHRMDPRMKLILSLLYIVCSFLCRNIISFGLLFVSAIVLILLSRIPMSLIMRSIRPILFILAFTVVINIFWTSGETLLFEWKFIHIYLEGVMNAVFMVLRIFVLIVGASLFLTYTTTPIALTDAIEQLFAPLKRIKVPVHEFAMMMTIALRFIPTLIDETDKIMSAQKARGADFTSGSLINRAKALIPILIPLFVSSFRRADELATAMECRCYHGGEGRTRMSILHYRALDFIAILIMITFGVSLVLLNMLGIGYTM
ncbi:MAG: energy-coupling factor transporter transmembrane protein EcfT [Clostridia bacterium]|nr:energy-coupling factor transporter transmembrane protein EcfT [Clostridia bacterium]MBQ8569622.1 energy-coupling factor transporter transmembrane protein EcfT [Oscillospiraceae bacterium]